MKLKIMSLSLIVMVLISVIGSVNSASYMFAFHANDHIYANTYQANNSKSNETISLSMYNFGRYGYDNVRLFRQNNSFIYPKIFSDLVKNGAINLDTNRSTTFWYPTYNGNETYLYGTFTKFTTIEIEYDKII